MSRVQEGLLFSAAGSSEVEGIRSSGPSTGRSLGHTSAEGLGLLVVWGFRASGITSRVQGLLRP